MLASRSNAGLLRRSHVLLRARRISGAKFDVDGKQYRLAPNEGTSSIHGGAVSSQTSSVHGYAYAVARHLLLPYPVLIYNTVEKDPLSHMPRRPAEQQLCNPDARVLLSVYCSKDAASAGFMRGQAQLMVSTTIWHLWFLDRYMHTAANTVLKRTPTLPCALSLATCTRCCCCAVLCCAVLRCAVLVRCVGASRCGLLPPQLMVTLSHSHTPARMGSRGEHPVRLEQCTRLHC
jgi:hypothetical protein